MTKQNDRAERFEQLVCEYRDMIFRTAIGFVHDRHDAEDITQEVFISAYKSWDSFRGDSRESTWLYRIAVNQSLNFIRSKRRRKILEVGEDILRQLFNRDSGQPDPQQAMEQAQQDEMINKVIDSLPDRQKTAFILSQFDQFSQQEISEVMQISEGAVEQLLVRARGSLKKKLDRTVGKRP